MIVCCHPCIDQDGIYLFRGCLGPGFQGDRPRPLLSPLLNKARTLTCIPPNDRKRVESDADQAVQLMYTTGGHDPRIWVAFYQSFEPLHNIVLSLQIQLVETID